MNSTILKSGEVLVIRKAKSEDASAIIEYINQVSGESEMITISPGEFNLTEAQEQKVISEHNNSLNQIFLIGEINGEIISVLNLTASPRIRIHHIGTFGMSVKKKHWNKGIGRLMLNYLISWSKSNEILTKINLIARADNLAAIHLYKSFGFVEEGRRSQGLKAGDKMYDTVLMGMSV